MVAARAARAGRLVERHPPVFLSDAPAAVAAAQRSLDRPSTRPCRLTSSSPLTSSPHRHGCRRGRGAARREGRRRKFGGQCQSGRRCEPRRRSPLPRPGSAPRSRRTRRRAARFGGCPRAGRPAAGAAGVVARGSRPTPRPRWQPAAKLPATAVPSGATDPLGGLDGLQQRRLAHLGKRDLRGPDASFQVVGQVDVARPCRTSEILRRRTRRLHTLYVWVCRTSSRPRGRGPAIWPWQTTSRRVERAGGASSPRGQLHRGARRPRHRTGSTSAGRIGSRCWPVRRARPAVADFHYANLALRGLGLDRVAGPQVERAVAMAPDLVAVAAGGNDVLRPRFDVEALGRTADDAIRRLTEAIDTVIVFAGFEPHPACPSAAPSRRGPRPTTTSSATRPPATGPYSSTCGPCPSCATRGCGARIGCTSPRRATSSSPRGCWRRSARRPRSERRSTAARGP